jgi:hypothetical protein
MPSCGVRNQAICADCLMELRGFELVIIADLHGNKAVGFSERRFCGGNLQWWRMAGDERQLRKAICL